MSYNLDSIFNEMSSNFLVYRDTRALATLQVLALTCVHVAHLLQVVHGRREVPCNTQRVSAGGAGGGGRAHASRSHSARTRRGRLTPTRPRRTFRSRTMLTSRFN